MQISLILNKNINRVASSHSLPRFTILDAHIDLTELSEPRRTLGFCYLSQFLVEDVQLFVGVCSATIRPGREATRR